jgi:hypothetical protein
MTCRLGLAAALFAASAAGAQAQAIGSDVRDAGQDLAQPGRDAGHAVANPVRPITHAAKVVRLEHLRRAARDSRHGPRHG